MIEVKQTAPAVVVIVKGCRAHPHLTKGRLMTVAFERCERTSPIEHETPERYIRVNFGRETVGMAGNRVKMPPLEAGKEYNLHNGNPLNCVRVRVMSS